MRIWKVSTPASAISRDNMKITFDLDSTLADMVSPWLVWLKTEGFTNELFTSADVKTYNWFMSEFGESVRDFFLKDPIHVYTECIKPFPGAKDLILWAIANKFEFEIVTHADRDSTRQAKINWINQHLGLPPSFIRFFENLHNKSAYLDESILIDDYPHHAIQHIARNKQPAIIFDYHGNNGWSKLEGYSELMIAESPDMNKCRIAKTYDEVKTQILILGNAK